MNRKNARASENERTKRRRQRWELRSANQNHQKASCSAVGGSSGFCQKWQVGVTCRDTHMHRRGHRKPVLHRETSLPRASAEWSNAKLIDACFFCSSRCCKQVEEYSSADAAATRGLGHHVANVASTDMMAQISTLIK